MSKAKEEEQLLEDASTLLMFANAAARQRSPASTPPLAQPEPPRLPTRSQSPPQGARPAELRPLENVLPLLGGLAAVSAPAVPTARSPGPTTAKHSPLASSHHSHGQQHGPDQDLGAQSAPAAFLPPLAHAHPISLPHLQQLPLASPPSAAQRPPTLQTRTYPYYPYGYAPGTLPPQAVAPYRAEIAPKPAQRQYPALSPKPSQEAVLYATQKLNLSPRQPSLPVQGSFHNSHKRTSSEGSQLKKPAVPSTFSPGSASVTLARGINVELKTRSNDNAVIAAAALAAAADIPLPLKNKRTREALPARAPDAAKPDLLPIAPKNEDSVMTEPEDDNRTEDEQPVAPGEVLDAVATESASSSTTTATPALPAATHPLIAPAAIAEVKEETTAQPVPEEPKEPYRPPPLLDFKVDPDAGTIGCICGIEEDDGFTIQCDVCFRWQHCSCMGYKTNEEVPENEYKCYYCDEAKWNKFEPAVCRKDTIARLELDKANEPQEKPAAPKRKTSSSNNDDKKRRKSEKEVRPASTERPPNDKRKSSGSTVLAASPNISNVSPNFEVKNKDNPMLEDGVTAEAYQSVYYRLEDNDYKTPSVKEKLSELGHEFEKSIDKPASIEEMSLAEFKLMKFSKVILPNYQKYLQDRNEFRRNKNSNKTTVKVKAYSDNPKQKFVGISKVGLFISDKSAQQGTECVIPPGAAVIEYLGEIDFFDHYALNHVNQYSAWGTVKPRVARVDLQYSAKESPLSLVIDSRFVGNEARFIRKSCPSEANCEIRPVYIPQLLKFKFIVVTTRPILLKGEDMDEELRIAWEWDEHHPIRKMLVKNAEGVYEEGSRFEDFSEEEKFSLVSGVGMILSFVECACNTASSSQQCSIFKVKKATSYLLRSTRKASSLSNIPFNKSKEELVMPRKNKPFISWKERLVERDNLIHLAVFSVAQADDCSETHTDDERPSGEGSDDLTQNGTDNTEAGFTHEVSQRVPFKKQFLAQGRRIASRKYKMENGSTAEINVDAIMEESTPKTLAIPLTSDILSSIKESVSEAFAPLKKLPSKGDVTNLDTKVVPGEVEESKTIKSNWTEKVPAKGIPPTEDVAATEHKPPVVKKLSFADYKKKMK